MKGAFGRVVFALRRISVRQAQHAGDIHPVDVEREAIGENGILHERRPAAPYDLYVFRAVDRRRSKLRGHGKRQQQFVVRGLGFIWDGNDLLGKILSYTFKIVVYVFVYRRGQLQAPGKRCAEHVRKPDIIALRGAQNAAHRLIRDHLGNDFIGRLYDA